MRWYNSSGLFQAHTSGKMEEDFIYNKLPSTIISGYVKANETVSTLELKVTLSFVKMNVCKKRKLLYNDKKKKKQPKKTSITITLIPAFVAFLLVK